MKQKTSEKIISIIIPNFELNKLDEVETNLTTVVPNGMAKKLIFVGNDLNNVEPKDNCVFVECEKNASYNAQITQGFSYATGECVIICDTASPRYIEYVQQMIISWQKGAKIVRLKKVKPTKFWDKFKQFFVNLKNKIYNIFLSLSGYTVDNLCVNSFQLFDKQVYNLIKAIPEKNSYLRNCSEFSYFNTVELETDENIKLKNDELKWNAKLIVSLCMLGLFAIFFTLSFVLYPLASQRNAVFTFISLMILLNIGFVLGAVIFFFSGLMDNKLGRISLDKQTTQPSEEVDTLSSTEEPSQAQDISNQEDVQTPQTEDITPQPKKEGKTTQRGKNKTQSKTKNKKTNNKTNRK